jgi:hypothetical protein
VLQTFDEGLQGMTVIFRQFAAKRSHLHGTKRTAEQSTPPPLSITRPNWPRGYFVEHAHMRHLSGALAQLLKNYALST